MTPIDLRTFALQKAVETRKPDDTATSICVAAEEFLKFLNTKVEFV